MMTQEKFREIRGGCCPVCGQGAISPLAATDVHKLYVDWNTGNLEIECGSCGSRWYEIYDLVGYEMVDNDDTPEEN